MHNFLLDARTILLDRLIFYVNRIQDLRYQIIRKYLDENEAENYNYRNIPYKIGDIITQL